MKGARGTSVAGATAGMGASTALQVSRRSAVTALAVSMTASTPSAPVCVIVTVQCWVERLVRAGRASTRKGASASAAAKLTVSATGSPSRSGWASTAASACAAVTPPNGPTMLA